MEATEIPRFMLSQCTDFPNRRLIHATEDRRKSREFDWQISI